MSMISVSPRFPNIVPESLEFAVLHTSFADPLIWRPVWELPLNAIHNYGIRSFVKLRGAIHPAMTYWTE